MDIIPTQTTNFSENFQALDTCSWKDDIVTLWNHKKEV